MSLPMTDYVKKSKEIFKYINDFRRNPKLLVRHLEKLKTYLDKNTNVLSEPGKIQVQMVEGEAVLNEAIAFLSKLKPLKELIWDENLYTAAIEHVLDIGPKGLLSYQSSDGTEPEDRIAKYGQYVESLGENIDFGPNDAMGVIVSLTLDDGEADRPHRENLFKTEYQKVGIACGPHSSEYHMCVMDFAYDFMSHDEVNGETNNYKNYDNDHDNHSKLAKFNLNVNNGSDKVASNINNYNDSINPSYTANFSNNTHQQKTDPRNQYDDTFGRANTANFPQTSTLTNHKPQNTETSKYAAVSYNQSPLVRLSIDKDEIKSERQGHIDGGNALISSDKIFENFVSNINNEKRIVSKFVEITTKIVYTFEDGSTKEVTEKQNHNFDLNNN